MLRESFGFPEFRGKQREIIERLLSAPRPGAADSKTEPASADSGHCLVLMPTGGGKSLCYQLPALCLRGGTLVISPLIALMKDQVDALRRKAIPATFINSTVGSQEREQRLAEFLDGTVKLLYVTPERFRKQDFVQRIRAARIALFAVDEAHCISEWGGDFRPDYSRLGEIRHDLGDPLTIALTATATPDVQRDIVEKLGLAADDTRVFHEGIARPNLRLEATEVFSEEEKLTAIQARIAQTGGAMIVYFSLIASLERASRQLETRGVPHLLYHGKLSASERKRAQDRFMRPDPTEPAPLILATNAFGMGVDKADIRSVIHAELPGSLEAYYQEIGRAGRDGRPAVCQLLYNQDDLAIQMEFIKWSNPEPRIYRRICDILERNPEKVAALGLEYLREQLHYKNRHDFRLETALRMLDRYGAIESGDSGNITGDQALAGLRLSAEGASNCGHLFDEDYHQARLVHEQKRLAQIVHYFRTRNACRRMQLSAYFGFPQPEPCGNCDRCDEAESN